MFLFFDFDHGSASVFAEVIDPRIPGDLEHPVLESISLTKGTPEFENPDKGLLCQILCGLNVTTQIFEKTVEDTMIFAKQYIELLNIIPGDPKHDVIVS